jgi:hypothetical protein
MLAGQWCRCTWINVLVRHAAYPFCSNELFTWNASTGELVADVTPAPPAPLCITAVDPAGAPFSQATLEACDGRPEQAWTWGADGTLAVTLPAPASGAAAAAPLCLAEIVPSGSFYVKPLAPAPPPGAARVSQPVAVAILNRDSTEHPGYTLDLTAFSFAPAAQILVRDVWGATTYGPVSGTFTTRPVASHETLLLKLYLA